MTPAGASLDLLANDGVTNGRIYDLPTAPSHGTANISPDGQRVVYSPASGYTGFDTFQYRIQGDPSNAISDVATVTINIKAINQPPLVAPDSYRTTKNTVLTVTAPGILSNDFDPDGNSLRVTSITTSPTHGTLSNLPDGSFSYTPNSNFTGLDRFQYTISDGSLVSSAATVVIEVANINFPPVASNDSYSTASNTPLIVSAPGLLANDSDPDGNQPLLVVVASPPPLGSLALGSGGGFTYTPNNVIGCTNDTVDTFMYYANDSVVNSNSATVTINIHCTNRAPVANADHYTVAQGGRLNIPPKGVLVNDTDPDGNTLSMVLVSNTSQGPLATNPDGSFTYIAPNAAGTDGFTYRASDGALQSGVATASITITATNAPPLAASDSYSTTKNAVLNVPAPGVLGNDLDLDGNPLSLTVMSQPARGSLQMNLDGSFIYTPASNYVGLDSFDYVARDGIATSSPVTVTIQVANANFPPVAQSDRYSVAAGTTLRVSAPGLLANDNDPDGNQPLLVILASPPTKGILTLTAGGGFEYKPNLSATCSADDSDSFTYFANDSVTNSNPATVSIAINCNNRAPIANADQYTIPRGGRLNIPPKGVLVNDTDPDGNTLSMVLVSNTSQGPLATNPDGSFSFLPPSSFNGPVTFTYKATDGALESAVATVTINVTAGNTAPLGGADSYQVTANTSLDVPASGVLGNDIDQENNLLSAILSTSPTHGSVHLELDGSFTYTPTGNYVGLDSFTYTAYDGQSPSNPVTVVIEVRGPGIANPQGIPTLSEWGIIILSSLLAFFGVRRASRRNGGRST